MHRLKRWPLTGQAKWQTIVARRAAAAGLVMVLAAAPTSLLAQEVKSEWVYPDENGKLAYRTTETGDRIMDFSHAGYMGGGVALPDVPVKRTVEPTGGEDDSAAIQAAIDEVAALPLEKGFRGAVLLAPGEFNCPETINISASGVVLRGSGAEGENRTTLKLTGRPHGAIAVRGGGGGGGGQRGQRGRRRGNEPSGEGQPPAATAPAAGQAADPRPAGQDQRGRREEFTPAQTKIADAYVPSGAMRFAVADAAGLAVGDVIAIRKPVTPEWVEFMEMHDLVRDGRPQTWIRPGRDITTERRIAAIDGNTLTLDVPLSDSFDAKFTGERGTEVEKIRPPQRVSQVGVEQLRIESPPQPFGHTQRHFTAMRINGEDCWARDIKIDETMNSIGIGGRRITLQKVSINREALHEGASKPAEFAPNGSQVLLDRCEVQADNVWFAATGGGQAGPIVLLNCTFRGNGRAESHQRWTTGMLYDNCRAPEGGLDFRNRGSMGSGHGWSMGWGVAWNCEANSYIIQRPPGAPNWMIGCIGRNTLAPRPFGSGPNLEVGIQDSPGTKVTPQSLYLAQLAERLGPEALANIGY